MPEFAPVELPTDFTWRELKAIGAWFPVPKPWFYVGHQINDTRAFLLSRDDFRRRNFFKTGLSINAVFKMSEKLGQAPSQWEVGNSQQVVAYTSLNNVTRISEGPFYTTRQLFTGLDTDIHMQVNLSVELTGNEQTGTGYLIYFQTPTDE
jgi:hypothetical protein